jgi:hypothetical protein
VRDLLSHRAALPPLPPGWQPPDPANPYAALTEAQLLQALGNTRLILRLQATGQPAFEVEVTGDDRIEVKRFGAVLQFNRNAQGVVDSATLLQQGRSLNGPRAGAPVP